MDVHGTPREDVGNRKMVDAGRATLNVVTHLFTTVYRIFSERRYPSGYHTETRHRPAATARSTRRTRPRPDTPAACSSGGPAVKPRSPAKIRRASRRPPCRVRRPRPARRPASRRASGRALRRDPIRQRRRDPGAARTDTTSHGWCVARSRCGVKGGPKLDQRWSAPLWVDSVRPRF